ncbi:hypothetical protein ASPZODRAFT_39994, partial [Penicilliopsis zonata CBS 506.65]
PSPPLGEILATISETDLIEAFSLEDVSTKIEDCETVASFNWLNRADPTIVVPGEPPAWSPLDTPRKLSEDSGQYFRDQNAARLPSYPLQPAVESILLEEPTFPTTEVDIVACGSTLGNLLRFVRKVDKPFRMLVEVVGSTVFFIRRENTPTELIQGVYGYGHTFPEAYTTWAPEVKGSESSQRIIQYSFGGAKCLVRFEADGYHPEMVSGSETESSLIQPTNEEKEDMEASENSLLATLSGASIGMHLPKSSTLILRPGGRHISQEAVFDLKTRTIKKVDTDVVGEELPRLWISQIPNFILAFHNRGVFEEIRKIDTRQRVQEWERENKPTLCQFASLLNKIIRFARGCEEERFELRRTEGSNTLELRRQCDDACRALPEHLVARWTTET